VRTLQVDALAGRVGRDEHAHLRVRQEAFLKLRALLPTDGTVDADHGLRAPEERADFPFEVVERVAVFGEHHQLLRR
jgi:hypothetical protein